MSVKTYRAKTMQEALSLVRRDLGPAASVLRTREVRGGGLLRWLSGARVIEVVASNRVAVPSRLPARARDGAQPALAPQRIAVAPSAQPSRKIDRPPARVDAPGPRNGRAARGEMPDALFRVFAELIEAEVHEDLAKDLLERLRGRVSAQELADVGRLREHLARMLEQEISVAGPIRLVAGHRHLVALVGPTGVGKTTTIAKLAANYRLREKRRVGLITVDTYRIAAVEQLRTYADIMDLPMEIVSTPRQMLQALAGMADLDLILMDTAGRSPRDDVKIQELKSMLAEAAPDEIHLVLSSVASASSLSKTAAQFAPVGTTALLLTKLDEAASLGNVLPLVRSSRLPLSYVTHGQNVPDDIAPADAGRLTRAILGLESVTAR